MTSDLFGGLGGLMKGLSGLMPQDDPSVKVLTAQAALSDLHKQEEALYAEIGRQAYADNPAAYPQSEQLRLVLLNIAEAEGKLNAVQTEKRQADQEKKMAEAKTSCPGCGHQNPEGTKFCQECGGKLGEAACQNCGAPLPPATRFCGECGARQD